MRQVTIAPGHWLAPDPAASYARMIRDGCPPGITSAGRTHDEQKRIFLSRYTPQATGTGRYGDVQWWNGVRYVRTSGPSSASAPGSARSLHERGDAIDVPEPARTWIRTHGAAYGWIHDTVPGEPWHMVYQPDRDTHPGSLVALPDTFQEDAVRRTTHDRKKNRPLPEKQWQTLPVNDKDHLSVSTTVGAFDSLAQLALTGVRPDAVVQVRFVVVESDAKGRDAKQVVTYPITEVHGSAGTTFGQAAQKGLLNALNGPRERRLRIQARAPHDGITLTRMQTRTDTHTA